ncbi:MarR family transcriptional regulator [Rhodococcus sp. 14-2483-1-2]|uniref:MarR family winged helix-turn-helix transcriptional regulator n=1 Tax=Rhodococcus sp. 14-2483-1-2 TaxID=2023147 RepID=UPI001BAFABD7|nr:MarR family transcriptional regulator [Rhodococcus sp. 14-2483-1-2]
MHANRVVASHLEHSGRRSNHAVLASLEESGPASQAGLARRFAIDRGDLVELLDRITEEGLAHHEPDTPDKRRNVITVTPNGRDKLPQLDEDIKAAQVRSAQTTRSCRTYGTHGPALAAVVQPWH